MDTVFNIAVLYTRTIGGYTRAQCSTVTGANVVILKDKVIKKLLTLAISMQHWITSFNPKELHSNKTNLLLFF